MPAELESPTQRTDAEPTSDQTHPTERFPYESELDRGTSLPTATARGVLRSSDDSDGTVGSTACPDCGGATINGAGLFTCQDCEWTGTLR